VNIDRVIALLQRLEGWRPYVYDDKSPWPRTEVGRGACFPSGSQYKVLATGGTATIGYGETLAEVIDRYWGRRITQGEALAIMRPRVQGFADGVRRCIDRSLTAHQWEACTCRAYQTGASGFCRSDVAARLNAGDVNGALDAWRRVFPHPNRSEVEIAHFLTPDDEEQLDAEDELFFFWHLRGLYLAGPGWRSPWGMHPDNIDPLLATGRYVIAGEYDRSNDLFEMLAPSRRENALSGERGFQFKREPEFFPQAARV
jgi:GH24 family phage-related lysozyme (muramidase)